MGVRVAGVNISLPSNLYHKIYLSKQGTSVTCNTTLLCKGSLSLMPWQTWLYITFFLKNTASKNQGTVPLVFALLNRSCQQPLSTSTTPTYAKVMLRSEKYNEVKKINCRIAIGGMVAQMLCSILKQIKMLSHQTGSLKVLNKKLHEAQKTLFDYPPTPPSM